MPKPITHGSWSGYVRGCRCDECMERSRTYQKERRDARRGRPALPRGGQRKPTCHGTVLEYSRGCRCTPCREAAVEQGRQYAARNPEKVMEARRAYAEANREAIALRRKAYRERNKEALGESFRAWYAANAEQQRERATKWAKDNPQRRAEATRRREARKSGLNHGCMTPQVAASLVEATDSKCVYCGAPYEHLDHIHPLSKRGMHCVQNIVPACAYCNISKRDKILAEPPSPVLLCPLPYGATIS